jgi:hypothetical protein
MHSKEMTDWLTDWLTDWVTIWPAVCLTDWPTDRLSDWLTEWQTIWLAVWLTDRLSDYLTRCLSDWLTDLSVVKWLGLWLLAWGYPTFFSDSKTFGTLNTATRKCWQYPSFSSHRRTNVPRHQHFLLWMYWKLCFQRWEVKVIFHSIAI